VLNRSRTLFETVPIEPFAAKGKAEPVHASIVGPILGRREARQGGLPLIGRDAELQVLMEVLDQARDEHGSIVEIGGEPGHGKTRLVGELIARSPDFQVIRSRCEEYESTTPYFPMRAVMRAVLGLDAAADTDEVVDQLAAAVMALDSGLEPWIPLLGILLGVDMPDTAETAALDDRFLRERLLEVALQFLTESLVGIPTMVVVEDSQFIDEATANLLVQLSRAAADQRLVLIVTHQGPGPLPRAEGGDGLVTALRIELGPIPPERMAEILELATEDAPLHPHEIEEIARRSGGNPLFLFELLDTVRETGTIESLPDSIESLIAGEIDRLAPSDRTILRYAAVLGTRVDPDLLASAVRNEVELDDHVWDRLGDLLRTQPSGDLEFRSSLIRDAAYEGLPYRRRRALHERIGETIEAGAGVSLDEEIGALALHYYEAQRWDKAWEFYRKAADRAMGMYANVEAIRSYERALVAGRRLRKVAREDLAAVYERLGDVRYIGEPERADEAFKAARRLVGRDPSASARLALKQAKQSTEIGRYPLALRRVSRALRRLDGVEGKQAAAQRARLSVWYGWVRFAQDRPGETIEWCLRAIREAKRAGADDALAQAYQFLDAALTENGEIEKADNSRLALEIYERLGDLSQQAITLNNMGVIAKERSRWIESRSLYDRARKLFEATGDRARESVAKYNIAEILSDQGHYEEAETLLREVVRVWRASGAETDVAEARRELGKLAARRGDFATAKELLEAARDVQASHGQPGEVLATDFRMAEALVIAAQSQAALELADEAYGRTDRSDGGSILVPSLLRVRGWALVQQGDVGGAREQFVAALTLARGRDDAYQTALALDGVIAIDDLAGADVSELEAERRAAFDLLGIVRTPAVPVSPREGVAPA
jgi:predicted ATPase